MREKCPYLELFKSVFCRIRTRITPNTDIFYAVDAYKLKIAQSNIQGSIHSNIASTREVYNNCNIQKLIFTEML